LRVVDPAPPLPPRSVFNFSQASPDSTTKNFSKKKERESQNKTKQTNKTSKLNEFIIPSFQTSKTQLLNFGKN